MDGASGSQRIKGEMIPSFHFCYHGRSTRRGFLVFACAGVSVKGESQNNRPK
jgi:hypothetical protein